MDTASRGSSTEITIAEKMTRVTENRSGAAPVEGCGEFRLALSRPVFGDIEVSAGTDAP